MAASQMRLLALTARKSDLEYTAQRLSSTKVQLANQSEEASQNYVNALNAKKLQVTIVDASSPATNYLKTENVSLGNLLTAGYIVAKRDSGGIYQRVLSVTDALLSAGLISGQYMLFDAADASNLATATPKSISAVSNIQEVQDNSNFAVAEAVYNQETSKLQRKEKQIDLQIQKIDTEHSALEAEYDSVKQVIKKNIESSFEIFG